MKKLLYISLIGISTISVFSQDLISSYSFTGNANDDNGSHDGTVHGAVLTQDRFGNPNNAYSFDGVDDYIALPASNDWGFGEGDFSISAWFTSTDDGPSDLGNIIRYDNGHGPASLWGVRLNSDELQFLGGQGGVNVTHEQVVTDGNWHHVVSVRKDFNLQIYYDGMLVVDSTLAIRTDIAPQLNYYPSIGRLGSYNGLYFNGSIDDIAIYDKALTQSEVSDLFDQGLCYETVTVTDTLVINYTITSYSPVEYANTIKVFPNPANDQLHIMAESESFGHRIRIINASSQEVHNGVISASEEQLDLSSWTGAGLYFLHLYDENDNLIDIKKIVLE